MLKIGEFSVLSTISISMLRHYDKLGLLVPVHIDEINGYRYYDEKQLTLANRIVAMKEMGFGLEEIKSALQATFEEREEQLQTKLLMKKKELQIIQDQIFKLEETMKLENQEEEYALSAIKKVIPEMNVISLRGKISTFSEEGILWKTLMEECQIHKINIPLKTQAISIQHEINQEGKYVDVEVMFAVDKKYKPIGRMKCYKLPKREVVSIVFKGNYIQIGRINVFAAKWLELNEYEICSTPFSIYHRSPREVQKNTEFITEICFPIKKRLNT